VPFELRVKNDPEPIYDFNLQDLGRVQEQPVLPFDAYGTMAWARNEFENNSASSQASLAPVQATLVVKGFTSQRTEAVLALSC
jgi:hypothetical protein